MNQPVELRLRRRLVWECLFTVLYFCLGIASLVRMATSGDLIPGLAALGNFGIGGSFMALGRYWRQYSLDLFSPISIALNTFGIYFLLVMSLAPDTTVAAMLFVVLTLLLCIGILISIPRIHLPRALSALALLRSIRSPMLIYRLLAAQAFGLLLFVAMSRVAGFASPVDVLLDPYSFREATSGQGMLYVKSVMDLFILGPVELLFIVWITESKRKLGLLLLLMASFGLVYTLASGSRALTVYFLVSFLIALHLRGKGLPVIWTALACIVSIPFVAIMGEWRSMAMYQRVSGADLLTMWKDLSWTKMFELFLRRFDAPHYFNLLMMHFQYYFDEPRYGLSYLEAFVQPIPRALWPDKPMLPNTQLSILFKGFNYGFPVTFDFGVFGEAFLNFGWGGVLFDAVVLAVIIKVFQALYEIAVSGEFEGSVLWVIVMWTLPMSCITSGFVYTGTLFFLSLLGYLTLWLFFLTGRGAS